MASSYVGSVFTNIPVNAAIRGIINFIEDRNMNISFSEGDLEKLLLRYTDRFKI